MKQRQKPRTYFESGYSEIISRCNDDEEETELFSKKPHQEVPTIEKVVEEGDTLQALSIRYHCTISELKRLNHIHRENEIFAKRSIKVPARTFSMALVNVHASGTSSPSDRSNELKKGLDAEALKSKLNHNILNITDASGSSSSNNIISDVEVNKVIFNTSFKPASKVCDNTAEDPIINEVDDEKVSLLPLSAPSAVTLEPRLSCNGADADIPWIALIVCIVVLIFAVPLIYIFYIAEHFEQYHHSDS